MAYSKAGLRSFLIQVDQSGESLRISKDVDPATVGLPGRACVLNDRANARGKIGVYPHVACL